MRYEGQPEKQGVAVIKREKRTDKSVGSMCSENVTDGTDLM